MNDHPLGRPGRFMERDVTDHCEVIQQGDTLWVRDLRGGKPYSAWEEYRASPGEPLRRVLPV